MPTCCYETTRSATAACTTVITRLVFTITCMATNE